MKLLTLSVWTGGRWAMVNQNMRRILPPIGSPKQSSAASDDGVNARGITRPSQYGCPPSHQAPPRGAKRNRGYLEAGAAPPRARVQANLAPLPAAAPFEDPRSGADSTESATSWARNVWRSKCPCARHPALPALAGSGPLPAPTGFRQHRVV